MEKINLYCDGVDYSQKTEDRPYCLPLSETGGVHIYVDKHTFKNYMDIIRAEVSEHDRLTRCMIPGERKDFIVCHHKCDECPFIESQFNPADYRATVSLDALYEDTEFEVASDEDIVADLYVKERREKAEEEISHLSDYQQSLLSSYSKKKNIREVASDLGIGKTKANDDLNEAINILREKCKGF